MNINKENLENTFILGKAFEYFSQNNNAFTSKDISEWVLLNHKCAIKTSKIEKTIEALTNLELFKDWYFERVDFLNMKVKIYKSKKMKVQLDFENENGKLKIIQIPEATDRNIINKINYTIIKRKSFTSVDISNSLKLDGFWVLNRDVSKVLNTLFKKDDSTYNNYNYSYETVGQGVDKEEIKGNIYFHEDDGFFDYENFNAEALSLEEFKILQKSIRIKQKFRV